MFLNKPPIEMAKSAASVGKKMWRSEAKIRTHRADPNPAPQELK